MLQVKEFYKDKVILISGCTGFVGKVVLEKFIRSVPDFKRIYVMIREKKGVSMQQRLNNIFQSMLFQDLFYKRPELKKIVA